MSEEIQFLSYEEARKIVGAVMEEEHIQEANRRILTAYDVDGKELCWYDADEIMSEIKNPSKNEDENKAAAVEIVLHQIPEWVLQVTGVRD
ncbi:MAG: hypothetical protein KAJ60_06315 [Desulfobulbaceae bacterium]|nr:hypothetical protein [Desulfobulbaceae bacterium]